MTDPAGLGTERLASLTDTEGLARRVAANAPAGAVLVLTGPLGAGKTTFTQALARALGSTAAVTSPTYTLVHEYPTPDGPLVHIDAYRLQDADLAALGFDDYVDRARLVVVEWGAPLLEQLPEALWLELEFADPVGGPGRLAHWRRPPPGAAAPSSGDRGAGA